MIRIAVTAAPALNTRMRSRGLRVGAGIEMTDHGF